MDENQIKTINCPSCGTINKGDNINCLKCGYQFKTGINNGSNGNAKKRNDLNVKLKENNASNIKKNTINCPMCGGKNNTSNRFCSNCGNALKDDEETKKIIEQTAANREQNTAEKNNSSLS